jgi:hypothetical protein
MIELLTLDTILKSPALTHPDKKISKLLLLYEAAILAKKSSIQGLWMEFGVFKAESVNFIAHVAGRETKIHGFDSFLGLPVDWIPGFPEGTFNRSGQLPEVYSNVILYSGWFKDTLPGFIEKYRTEKIQFLHIDCDLYESTAYVLKSLDDQIGAGTIIVFDELINYDGYEDHEFKALNEYLSESGKSAKVLFHNDYEQVVVVIE